MSNQPDMVEHVARAISVEDREGDYWEVMSEVGDGHGYLGRREYRAMARAAIAAVEQYLSELSRKNDRLASHYAESFPEAAESIKALREAIR